MTWFSDFVTKYICFDYHTYGHIEQDGIQRCLMCGKIKECEIKVVENSLDTLDL